MQTRELHQCEKMVKEGLCSGIRFQAIEYLSKRAHFPEGVR